LGRGRKRGGSKGRLMRRGVVKWVAGGT